LLIFSPTKERMELKQQSAEAIQVQESGPRAPGSIESKGAPWREHFQGVSTEESEWLQLEESLSFRLWQRQRFLLEIQCARFK